MFKCFIALKLAQFLVAYFTPTTFDVSSHILDDLYPTSLPSFVHSFLKKILVWDNVHFTDLIHNEYKYEHQYVFSPGWVAAIRYVCAFMNVSDFYAQFLVAVVVANVCQLAGAYVLYFYTKKVFSRIPMFKNNASRFAFLAGQYYILSPGGIFLTSGYSENLGSLLSFVGLFLREYSITLNREYTVDITNKLTYFVSGVVVAYAFTVRANLLLLGLFYVYDLWYFRKNLVNVVFTIASGLPLFYQFVKVQYDAYATFCPQRGEWCDNLVPSLFQYCQTHYWNNGFLNYWTLNNLPNFILALPIIAANLYLVVWLQRYPTREFVPYMILNTVVVVVGLFFWNVQILTRIMNFNPIFYWFLALFDERMVRVVLVYWIVVQTGLFAAFLPPA